MGEELFERRRVAALCVELPTYKTGQATYVQRYSEMWGVFVQPLL